MAIGGGDEELGGRAREQRPEAAKGTAALGQGQAGDGLWPQGGEPDNLTSP